MKWLHRAGWLFLGCMLMLVLLFLDEINTLADKPYAPARIALKDTDLNPGLADTALRGRAVHFDSHGGFHGDGCTVTIFQTSPGALWEAIVHADRGWTVEPVDPAAYAARVPACSCHPVLYPPPDVVFDAWYSRNDYEGPLTDSGQPFSINRTAAFFDAETGLFFYCRMDT